MPLEIINDYFLLPVMVPAKSPKRRNVKNLTAPTVQTKDLHRTVHQTPLQTAPIPPVAAAAVTRKATVRVAATLDRVATVKWFATYVRITMHLL